MFYKVVLAFDSVHEILRKCDNSSVPEVQFTFLYKVVTGKEFNTFTGNLGQHVSEFSVQYIKYTSCTPTDHQQGCLRHV